MSRQNDRTDIAIVGGGAAGLAAAVAAGEALRESGMGVVLCEASDRVGRSILATGNGRCNFSNTQLTDEVLRGAEALAPFYHNAEFVAHVFAALEGLSLFRNDASEQSSFSSAPSNAALRFFAQQGLVWREESEGRLYPLANKASSVLDVLRAAVDGASVDVLTEFSVRIIARQGNGFLLQAEDGRKLHAQQVILAMGGATNEDLAASLDLPFIEQRPVLGPLAVDAEGRRITKRLDNIRVKAFVSLQRDGVSIRREQGEVLFRAYGLSGIAVFDLSREAQPGDEVSLDLLSQIPPEATTDLLSLRADRLSEYSAKQPTYADVLRGMVLPQVAEALCGRAQVQLGGAYDALEAARLADALHDLRFTVEGIGDARQCQVKRGGIAVTAFASETLEAVSVPGLYAVGEALDVDAACGGFNLHWAWASGMLAGHMAAEAVLRSQKRNH